MSEQSGLSIFDAAKNSAEATFPLARRGGYDADAVDAWVRNQATELGGAADWLDFPDGVADDDRPGPDAGEQQADDGLAVAQWRRCAAGLLWRRSPPAHGGPERRAGLAGRVAVGIVVPTLKKDRAKLVTAMQVTARSIGRALVDPSTTVDHFH